MEDTRAIRDAESNCREGGWCWGRHWDGFVFIIVEDVKTKKMEGRAPTSVRKAILFSGC